MTSVDVLSLARTGSVHFMGVGGAGMCALAELVLRSGGRVTGCDLTAGANTARLDSLGVSVHTGHDPAHVADSVAVVVTSAVPQDHPELERARELQLPILKRARVLGDVVNAGRVVAIAGTHGKTSTTAMATEMLAAAGMDPTGFVGGRVSGWNGHLRLGGSDLYVVEADEFDRSFHTLEPDVAVVTNLEADHLDVYGDLEGVREAFGQFLEGRRPDGRVVICADDPGASRLLARLNGSAYTYGLSAGSQLRGSDVVQGPAGSRCRVVEDGGERGVLEVPVPGLHNLRNALGAVAATRKLGADWDAIRKGLAAFRGVGRRFQLLAEIDGRAIVDDYAHHPTEIEATLAAARATFRDRPLVAVFQPHLYSRTRDFADRFGAALAAADLVFVTDVYPAREPAIPGVTGQCVVDEVVRAAPSASVRYHPALDGLAEAVISDSPADAVVLVMGAGSVERVGPRIVQLLRGESLV